ncbi:MAG: hypothetical protein ACRYG8_04060 [Janthinobacterium lividum]
MNALAHCIDAIYVPTVSPFMAFAAVERARVAANPADLTARTDLLYEARLGGNALSGGYTLQHGLSQSTRVTLPP